MAKQSFPEITETQRLVLQRYRSDDASGILELVHRNRAQLIRDFEQQAGLQSLADAQAFTADKEEQWSCGKTFCYGIWRKPAKEQVGQIQVKNIELGDPSAEPEYFIVVSKARLRDRE
jgi:hypothetical protein